jgi:hypothetical protein
MSKQSIIKKTGKPRGKPFEKGNPGKPRGARNKTTAALETILFGNAEAITNKAIELALVGNPMALRLCVERIFGTRSERMISVDVPPLKSATDGALVLAALVEKVTGGEITPGEGALLSELVERTIPHLKEREGFEKRLEAVTQAMEKSSAEGEDRHSLSELLKPFERVEQT